MGWTGIHQDGEIYWHASEREGLDARCGGGRTLRCHCGGDLCVCGNFGEAECYGCTDCDDTDDDMDYWDEDDSPERAP